MSKVILQMPQEVLDNTEALHRFQAIMDEFCKGDSDYVILPSDQGFEVTLVDGETKHYELVEKSS